MVVEVVVVLVLLLLLLLMKIWILAPWQLPVSLHGAKTQNSSFIINHSI
jgi:hypothetical protein